MSTNKYNSNQYNAQPPGGQPYGAEDNGAGGMDGGFRKHYGFRYGQEMRPETRHLGYAPEARHGTNPRYGFQTGGFETGGFQTGDQGQAELVTPAIRASTPRPDWLDDSDPEETRPQSPAPEPPKAPPASTPSASPDPWTPDAPASPERGPAASPAPKTPAPEVDRPVPPAEAATSHTSSAGAAPGDAPATDWTRPTAAPEPPKPATITSPMQLEWFVKEDATNPWEDESDATETDTPAGFEPDTERDAHTVPPVSQTPAPQAEDPRKSTRESHQGAAQAKPVAVTAIELDLYADRRYRAALERMQFAQWSETLLLLRAVERDFPNHPTLAALINEAELKAGVVEQWADKVRPRRLTVRQETLIRRAIPIMLLLVLFIGAAGFYRAFVEPSRQAVAVTQTTLRMLDEAQQLAFAGRFAESMSIYDSVLTRDPGNPLARQGRHEAQTLYAVATEYTIAMRVAQAGNYPRAAGLLENLLARSPGYRDAEAQLAAIRTQMSAQELFDAAQANYRLHRWLPAVQGYEALMAMDSEFQAATVRQNLQDSYVQAGLALVEQWPAERSDLDLAREYFRKAATTRRSDAVIQAELDRLDRFFRGEQALGNSDLREAINIWRSLYDETPQYLGGYLAEQLYRAYLNLANRALQQNDTIYAADLYQLALELNVKDKNEAQRGLDQIRAQAVAPSPTAAL